MKKEGRVILVGFNFDKATIADVVTTYNGYFFIVTVRVELIL